MSNHLRKIQFSDLVRHFLLSWLVAVLVSILLLPPEYWSIANYDGIARTSLKPFILVGGFSFLLLTGINLRWNIVFWERWGIVGLFTVLALITLCTSFYWGYLLGCVIVVMVLAAYALYGYDSRSAESASLDIEKPLYYWIIGGMAFFLFILLCIWGICRIYSFYVESFDFGLFGQMFYYMKKTGLPLTTLERGTLLSHFMVHISPIYYLLLPFYAIVPKIETLQVLQAAVIISSVIPLWKIASHHGLTGWKRVLICTIFMLYPALSGGIANDLHENCFLTPLLLWLFYAIDKDNYYLAFSAAILTLTIKEDAAVYIAVIALWLIIRAALHWSSAKQSKKAVIAGSAMLVISLAWFLLATGFLSRNQYNVMGLRFENFMYGNEPSLNLIVRVVLLNPLKAIYECMKPDKLRYIAYTMLPLLFLPMMTRKYERYILLIPYILINLMDDYRWQHSIYWQYNFGSFACLIYLIVLNVSDFKNPRMFKSSLTASALACFILFQILIVPVAVQFPKLCIQNSAVYSQMRELFDEIPSDASVAASPYYGSYFSQRDELYDVKFSGLEQVLDCDYLVLKHNAAENEAIFSGMQEKGYKLFSEMPGVLQIYQKSGS